jgi:hypothetical protein
VIKVADAVGEAADLLEEKVDGLCGAIRYAEVSK